MADNMKPKFTFLIRGFSILHVRIIHRNAEGEPTKAEVYNGGWIWRRVGVSVFANNWEGNRVTPQGRYSEWTEMSPPVSYKNLSAAKAWAHHQASKLADKRNPLKIVVNA